MANKNRYHHGHQNIVQMPVASATVIEIGDFIAISSGKAIPVGGIADAGDAAANREAAADAFIGIAQSASANGETDDVLVDISLEAVHELTLQTAAALSFGDYIEIYADTAGCHDQLVVAGSTSPVAFCVKEKAATGTAVLACLANQTLLRERQT